MSDNYFFLSNFLCFVEFSNFYFSSIIPIPSSTVYFHKCIKYIRGFFTLIQLLSLFFKPYFFLMHFRNWNPLYDSRYFFISILLNACTLLRCFYPWYSNVIPYDQIYVDFITSSPRRKWNCYVRNHARAISPKR